MEKWLEGFIGTGLIFGFILFIGSGNISPGFILIGGIIGAIVFPKFKKNKGDDNGRKE
jgi:hypothetical protein